MAVRTEANTILVSRKAYERLLDSILSTHLVANETVDDVDDEEARYNLRFSLD